MVTTLQISQCVVRCACAPVASALWLNSWLFGSRRSLTPPFRTPPPSRAWCFHVHSSGSPEVRIRTCVHICPLTSGAGGGKVPIRHVDMSLWGEVAVANTLLEAAGHDPPSLPPQDLGSFPHRLQELSALLVSSAKRHIFVTEYHTLCLHSRVSPSHPLTPPHTHAAPPDQIPLISEHIHMAEFFIRASRTLCDRNKLSLSRQSSVGLPVFGSPKQKSYRVWLNLFWNQSKARSGFVSVLVIT